MKKVGITGFVVWIGLQSTAIADEQVKALYHYRSDVMEASSSHLKALKGYVNGELPIKAHVPVHVDALLALSDLYQDIFPVGSQYAESEAKAVIWSDPKGFRQAIEINRRSIAALKQIDPEDTKVLKRAVNQVRMTCGDCHYYFRDR